MVGWWKQIIGLDEIRGVPVEERFVYISDRRRSGGVRGQLLLEVFGPEPEDSLMTTRAMTQDLYAERVEVQKALDETFPEGCFLELYQTFDISERVSLIRKGPVGRIFCVYARPEPGKVNNLWGLLFPFRTVRDLVAAYYGADTKPWSGLWDGEWIREERFGHSTWEFESLSDRTGRPVGLRAVLYQNGTSPDRGMPPEVRQIFTEVYERYLFPNGLK